MYMLTGELEVRVIAFGMGDNSLESIAALAVGLTDLGKLLVVAKSMKT